MQKEYTLPTGHNPILLPPVASGLALTKMEYWQIENVTKSFQRVLPYTIASLPLAPMKHSRSPCPVNQRQCMGLPNVVDQARAIIACGCTRKPQLEKHVQSLSFLGGFSFGSQHKEIAIDMVPFVATFSKT